MNDFYIYDYLKKDNEYYIDLLKFEIDKSIYYYWEHFKSPKENYSIIYIIKRRTYFYLWQLLKLLVVFKNIKNTKNEKIIVSNAYAWNWIYSLNSSLEKLWYKVISSTNNLNSNNWYSWKIFILQFKIEKVLLNWNIAEIINEPFFNTLKTFESVLLDFYKKENIKALFIPNDIWLYEKILINVFKKLNKPTFLFSHWIPWRYNNVDENRTDYLIVWGEKVKENYINAWISKNKIFVSWHPWYWKIAKNELKFWLENILIIWKGVNWWQHWNSVILSDRWNLIIYLYSLQNVLKKFE